MSTLNRFKIAQDSVYKDVIAELKAGKKQSHWMWFIFPQISGLGKSPMSQKYAIHNLETAKMYLDEQPLASRLEECTKLVLSHENIPLADIFGEIDTLKFRSSMTLFDWAKRDFIFEEALNLFCKGKRCAKTIHILKNEISK